MDGEKLKYWRLARGLSIRQLADRAAVDYSAISAIERGKRTPHPGTISKLARALDIEITELLRAPGTGPAARHDPPASHTNTADAK